MKQNVLYEVTLTGEHLDLKCKKPVRDFLIPTPAFIFQVCSGNNNMPVNTYFYDSWLQDGLTK